MPKKRRQRFAPPECPVCGAEVHPNALACRECGADHNSGWREDAETYDGIDLPAEGFDYDEFVRREFGGGAKPAGIKPVWWVTAVILLIASIVLHLRGWF